MLRLTPTGFWSMTPRELALALRGPAGLPSCAPDFARGDLATLMQRYPDA